MGAGAPPTAVPPPNVHPAAFYAQYYAQLGIAGLAPYQVAPSGYQVAPNGIVPPSPRSEERERRGFRGGPGDASSSFNGDGGGGSFPASADGGSARTSASSSPGASTGATGGFFRPSVPGAGTGGFGFAFDRVGGHPATQGVPHQDPGVPQQDPSSGAGAAGPLPHPVHVSQRRDVGASCGALRLWGAAVRCGQPMENSRKVGRTGAPMIVPDVGYGDPVRPSHFTSVPDPSAHAPRLGC